MEIKVVNKWVISDTHFGHSNIIKFTGATGRAFRGSFIRRKEDGGFEEVNFRDIKHHDEHIVEMWNSVIKPGDKVYHLGDFGDISYAKRLHGKIRLILGNHDDQMDKQEMVDSFDKILVSRRFKSDFAAPTIFSHFPLHPGNNGNSARLFNVHGHIHEKEINDPWYLNVCVEQTNMQPLSWEELAQFIKQRTK